MEDGIRYEGRALRLGFAVAAERAPSSINSHSTGASFAEGDVPQI